MKLTQLALNEIKSNKRLRNRLALDLDKTSMTIFRWISNNDINLTREEALQIILEETGLQLPQVLDGLEEIRA
jgi:hypothetical protein